MANFVNLSIPQTILIMSTLESNIQRVFEVLLPKILARHQSSSNPVVLGITGLQGSGKSTWATKIAQLLRLHHLCTVAISLDDFYKTHDDLIAQQVRNPENHLYRMRGQPGTHDEKLAQQVFRDMREYESPLRIPSFNKSKFNGEGDRAPWSEWQTLTSKPDVIVFEGWCVGFRPLDSSEVQHKLAQALEHPISILSKYQLKHLVEVNENLKSYCNAFMGPQHFDLMIHIDTDDLRNVYKWRLQQERQLIEQEGTGMTDEEVAAFIDGYMPGYELYLDNLRNGLFGEKSGRQIRVLMSEDRQIEKVEEL
jgi:D-glycerate 3-kinase